MSGGAPNTGDVIRTYLRLRDEKAAIENEAKERVKDIVVKLDKLEAYLKSVMDEQGITSVKSTHGTAFITTTDYANVQDWDAVLAFIQENNAYDMLEKRVSKTAVRGYITESKAVPPGVNYGTRLSINVRKAAATGE